MSQNNSVVTLTDEEKEDYDYEDIEAIDQLDDTQIRCKQIEERISSLREALGSLLENVKREKELWKQEMAETLALGNQLQSYMEKHEDCHKNCFSAGDSNQAEIDTIANTVLRTDAVAKAQMHMEMEKYQHKLSKVENMCQLEMLKLKSSVHELAPLKLIAKEWNKSKGNVSAPAETLENEVCTD